MRLERVGKRRSRPDLLVHVVEDGLEHRIGEANPQDVERLHERHAGLEQRRQFLIEDQELVPRDLRPPAAEREPAQAAPGAQREHVQPLVLQLVPEVGFALGDVHALDDLAAGRGQPAPEFHA